MNIETLFLGFLPHLGAAELFFIAFIVLMLFGAKRLPEIAKGFGKAVREFRKSALEFEGDFRKSMENDEANDVSGKVAPKSPLAASKREDKELSGTVR